MAIAVFVDELKRDGRIVALQFRIDFGDRVVLQKLFDVFVQRDQRICEIHFEGARIVLFSLHVQPFLFGVPTDQGRCPG